MSDEVSQFLEQVEKLRGQQIEEDEVRAKELEDYLAAKRERQARREERARSISPQKSSPANTPSPRSQRRLRLDSPQRITHSREASVDSEASFDTTHEQSQQHQQHDSIHSDGGSGDAMAQSTSPSKENQAPFGDGDIKRNSGTVRGSPLAWQRRPTSRGGSRPLSMVAAQNATQRSLAGTQEPHSATESNFSKEQIAQALGSKDPAWFRQTADRGQGSAAYRRNQVEDEDRLDMSSVKAQLPGMSAEETPQKKPSVSIPEPTTPRAAMLGSPLPLHPPSLDGPADEQQTTEAGSPQGRGSPTRSGSPTKGMGGFVQSAMMKRSDSVKRWSVTSPPGLTRADSVASNRTSFNRHSMIGVSSRPQSMIRDKSTTPGSSRPTSRHGDMQPEPVPEESQQPAEPSIAEALAAKLEDVEPEQRIPTSPSKTMDPRRWSPTKASWLETALNKPESPKPQSKPGTPTQPTWMAELTKQKTGGDGSRRDNAYSHKHQVSIGGLMRSSPMGGGAKPNSTGLGGIYSPPPGGNRPLPGHSMKLSISKSSLGPDLDQELQQQSQPSSPEKPEEPAIMDKEEQTERRPSAVGSPTPVSVKPKPEVAPKKDFRASLRQRPAESTTGKAAEPEFKNVFGNLRRTKTQNYVAPDPLKDNITRGKAALNVTGGPKQTERVDEFKDAILKKKEDFKKAQADGKGVARARSSTVVEPKPLPEGLARRATLGRSKSFGRRAPSTDHNDEPTTAPAPAPAPAPTPKKTESPKPSPKPKRISSQPLSSPGTPVKSPESEAQPETPKRVSTEPAAAPETEPERRALPTLHKEVSAPSRLQQQGKPGVGKLADRFNPGLAGLLARGPPPMSANGGKKSEDSTSSAPAAGEPAAPGPQLTHMTKNRARGPRRKAPTASAAPAEASKPAASAEEVRKPSPAPESVKSPATPVAAPTGLGIQSPKSPAAGNEERSTPSTPSFSVQQQVAAKAALRNKPTPPKPEPKSPEPKDSPAPVRPFAPRRLPSQPSQSSERPPSPIRPHKTGDAASQPGSPRKLDMKRMSRFFDGAADATPTEPKEPIKLTHQRTGSRSPVKFGERTLPEPAPSSPTKVDSEPVGSVGDVASKFGGAATKSPPVKPKPSFEKASPITPTKANGPRALPIPLKGVAKSPPPAESPVRSPTKDPNDISTLFKDFFGSDMPRQPYKVDPAELLMSRPQPGDKVKSLGVQMCQISGDGKKVPVPAHHERVLFDQEMYVCSHEFATTNGKKFVEVYFWVGDGVSESAAEDAQLFASREARALGGKLVKMRQGKESSEFMQALGGVIIVRKGSSKKFDQLAPSMLCGRRYLGEVAFDEVEFTLTNLCAGFAYLIAQGGQCYLWKGKGCDVDEVSCAKLVGMELALMGELVEVEDGNEPDTFWGLFQGGRKPHSADHWRLKPSYGKYGSRLFCSDAESRQQIYELHPFNQSDLSSSSIYVLDAFFEMYIIVGSRAQSQYASFRNALDFAQEYAILASGMEDRPFVPISTVVMEGIPKDLKSVFRKWEDGKSPTVMAGQQQSPAAGAGLKRGRSLRVVGLTQALQALTE